MKGGVLLGLVGLAGSVYYFRAPLGRLLYTVKEKALPESDSLEDEAQKRDCFDNGLNMSKGGFNACMAEGFIISRKGDKAHADLTALAKEQGVKPWDLKTPESHKSGGKVKLP